MGSYCGSRSGRSVPAYPQNLFLILKNPNDRNYIRLSVEALLEIEQALNSPSFLGASVGPTLCTKFEMDFWLGEKVWSWLAVGRDILVLMRYLLLGRRGTRSVQQPEGTGRIVITWPNMRQHLTGLTLPVIECLRPEKIFVIGGSDQMRQYLPQKTAFKLYHEIHRIPRSQWAPAYLKCIPVWHRQLRRALKSYGVGARVLPDLHAILLYKCQMIADYGAWLDRVRPCAILTESDRYEPNVPLILAARTRNIPTFTMQHGMPNAPIGSVPLLSDRIFCWGNHNRAEFLQWGVPPHRIMVTGCQAITRTLSADKIPALQKLELPTDRPVILLATNPIAQRSRHQLARVFCEGVTKLTGMTPVVRLHPSEQVDFYESERQDFPGVRFLRNHEWSLDEAIAAADVVVCHNTGFGLDALVKRKPVVVLDAIDEPLVLARGLVERGGCPKANDPDQLQRILNQILHQPTYRKALFEQAEAYVAYVYAAFGKDAARNVADFILQAISEI